MYTGFERLESSLCLLSFVRSSSSGVALSLCLLHSLDELSSSSSSLLLSSFVFSSLLCAASTAGDRVGFVVLVQVESVEEVPRHDVPPC